MGHTKVHPVFCEEERVQGSGFCSFQFIGLRDLGFTGVGLRAVLGLVGNYMRRLEEMPIIWHFVARSWRATAGVHG